MPQENQPPVRLLTPLESRQIAAILAGTLNGMANWCDADELEYAVVRLAKKLPVMKVGWQMINASKHPSRKTT